MVLALNLENVYYLSSNTDINVANRQKAMIKKLVHTLNSPCNCTCQT